MEGSEGRHKPCRAETAEAARALRQKHLLTRTCRRHSRRNARGTAARYLRSVKDLGIESAGKTGTTQNNCDRRYVGYTPRLLAGVWMGYDYPAELRGIHGNPCVMIWDDLMAACETAYRGAPQKTAFDLPDTVTEVEFCPLSGCLPGEFCTHPIGGRPTERGWFVRGTEPTDTCTLHGEPPIPLVPHDPADPDRIPLLPNDLAPDPLPRDPKRSESGKAEVSPWYSRWFSFFSRWQ